MKEVLISNKPGDRSMSIATPCSTGEVARHVALPRWRLLYLLDRDLVPDASLRAAGRRLFTDADIADIVAALRAQPQLTKYRTNKKLKV